MKTNKPLLTISLLISNRLDTIPRCLDSLLPIMESIPCELILIDTSKNPEVHSLLLEYTDQVYEFEWCKDFAKARNEGLKRARGEWFLYLDDDEWFEETGAIIDFFKSGEYKQYGYANYQQRNFMDVKYTHYNDCWVSRMVRVDENVRFVSKIHEYFSPVSGPRKDLYVIANHSGYIYDTPEKRRAHFERNYTLLLDMIKEEPNHLRWRLQLAQEYSGVEEWEDLVNYCEECLGLVAHIDTDYMNNNIGTFYTGLVVGLFRQEKYEESIKACKRALEDKRCREVLKAMMHLKLGENYLHLEQWDDAIKQVKEYLQILHAVDRETLAIREQEFALLVGDALEDTKQKVAYAILICCQLEKGNITTLLEYYEKLGWNKEVIYSIGDVEKYMVKAMWTLPYHPIFARIIMDALRNKDLRALFCKAILSQDIQEISEFQTIFYAIAEAMKCVVDGPQLGDMIGYYNGLQKYVQAICQWCDFIEAQDDLDLQAEEIPCYIQAAMDISDYVELESQDTIQALSKLKEAVESLPEFADGIGNFLHFYADLEKQRVAKQRKEMEALRIQVISQVKTMLKNGQNEAALQIIGQLKQMFPEDLEVVELALETRVKN